MNNETFTLIDTTIKIGLGALIASISSYYLTKLNHRIDSRKEFYKRYYDSIEKISDAAEEYFQKWARFTSAVSGVSKAKIEKGIPLTDDSWKKITDRDEILFQSRDNKMTAISRLKLLGLNDVATTLEETTKIENELRDIVIFERKVPKLNSIQTIQEKMKEKRNSFYKELNKYYKENKITSP